MCEKRLRTITAISTQILEQRCMCITHVKINHQVCRKRPRNVKRDLDICQKRPRNVKRDPDMSKETQKCRKELRNPKSLYRFSSSAIRAPHMSKETSNKIKRDPDMSKETQKCQKEPGNPKSLYRFSSSAIRAPHMTYVERDLEQNQKRHRNVTRHPDITTLLYRSSSCVTRAQNQKRPRTISDMSKEAAHELGTFGPLSCVTRAPHMPKGTSNYIDRDVQLCQKKSRKTDIAVQVFEQRYMRRTCQKRPRHMSKETQKCQKELRNPKSLYRSSSSATCAPHMSKETSDKIKRDLEQSQENSRHTDVAVQVLEQRCTCIAHVKRDLGQNEKTHRNVKKNEDIPISLYRSSSNAARASHKVKERTRNMSTGTQNYVKRDLEICPKRPRNMSTLHVHRTKSKRELAICSKAPRTMSKETLKYVQRDLELCQKRPRNMSTLHVIAQSQRENSQYVDRHLELCQKRPRNMSKETQKDVKGDLEICQRCT